MAHRPNILQTAVSRARLRLTGQGGFTLPELLLVVVIGGLILGVMTSGFILSAKTTSAAGTRLGESRDAQLVAAYFNADLANSNFFSRTDRAPWSACPVTGISKRVAMISWKESGVAKDAFYIRPTSSPTELRRRYCVGGSVVSEIAVARNLAAADPEVTCRLPLDCVPVPGWVNLKVREKSGAFDYQLRNTPRSASASGGAMGAFSIFVGSGGVKFQSNGTDLTALAGTIYNGGTLTCHAHATLIAPGGLYGPAAQPACGDTSVPTSVIPAQSDPLANLDYPAVPATAATTTAASCVPGKPTYQPGVYTAASPTIEGCMAGGIHYFKNGVKLTNVTAAPGASLLIFVEAGNVDLAAQPSETVDFSNLADNDYGNVVLFLARESGGGIASKGHVKVDGIVYGANAFFDAQTPHDDFFAMGINVRRFEFQANGLITVP